MVRKTNYSGSEDAIEDAVRQLETDTVIGGMLADALERTVNGTYGHCERCLQTIPAQRLLALPWVKFCAPCQDFIDSVR